MKNPYLTSQVNSLEATLKIFISGCELSVTKDDGKMDREEARALRRLRAATDRYLKVLEKYK